MSQVDGWEWLQAMLNPPLPVVEWPEPWGVCSECDRGGWHLIERRTACSRPGRIRRRRAG